MPWQSDYDQLKDAEKEQFARTLSILFDQTFIVRDIWDAKNQRLTGNRDYRFMERMRPLLEEYLKVSGWELQVDGHRGVIALYNRFGHNRLDFDKLTTYVLYTLRLIYDEEMERVSQRREVVFPLRAILEKLHAFGIVEKRMPVTHLQSTMMRLRRLSVVERIEGEGVHPDSRWILYPSIRLLVPDERINAIYENLDTLTNESGAEYEEGMVDNPLATAGDGFDDDADVDIGMAEREIAAAEEGSDT